MPRRPDLPPETLEERWQLEAQTARNLEAFEAEREGRLDDAIALYERNVAESFPGDLPYGRLVAIYERAADLDAAERVLRRAIAVFESTTRRTPQDRRATLRVFQRRLKLLEQQRRAATAESRYSKTSVVGSARSISTRMSAPSAATPRLVPSISATLSPRIALARKPPISPPRPPTTT